MTDSDFPRKSNLNDRKQAVLKIAAENFQMVQRLARVQSSVGRLSNTPKSDGRYRSRPRSSNLAISYPNVMDPKAQQIGPHARKVQKMQKSRTAANLAPLDAHAATSEALEDYIKVH